MARQPLTPQLQRAWWAHKQGSSNPSLNPRRPRLARAGWARSVAGVGPYLTLHARAGLSRESVDAAVAALEIHELPSTRACTYVLPAADYALALTLAAASGDSEMKVALKLGVTEKEVDALSDAVLRALKFGPAEPDGSAPPSAPKPAAWARKDRKRASLRPSLWPSAACSFPVTSAACPPTAAWTSSAIATPSGSPTL